MITVPDTLTLGPRNMYCVPERAASESPESFSGMQDLRPQPRPTE